MMVDSILWSVFVMVGVLIIIGNLLYEKWPLLVIRTTVVLVAVACSIMVMSLYPWEKLL